MTFLPCKYQFLFNTIFDRFGHFFGEHTVFLRLINTHFDIELVVLGKFWIDQKSTLHLYASEHIIHDFYPIFSLIYLFNLLYIFFNLLIYFAFFFGDRTIAFSLSILSKFSMIALETQVSQLDCLRSYVSLMSGKT